MIWIIKEKIFIFTIHICYRVILQDETVILIIAVVRVRTNKCRCNSEIFISLMRVGATGTFMCIFKILVIYYRMSVINKFV